MREEEIKYLKSVLTRAQFDELVEIHRNDGLDHSGVCNIYCDPWWPMQPCSCGAVLKSERKWLEFAVCRLSIHVGCLRMRVRRSIRTLLRQEPRISRPSREARRRARMLDSTHTAPVPRVDQVHTHAAPDQSGYCATSGGKCVERSDFGWQK